MRKWACEVRCSVISFAPPPLCCPCQVLMQGVGRECLLHEVRVRHLGEEGEEGDGEGGGGGASAGGDMAAELRAAMHAPQDVALAAAQGFHPAVVNVNWAEVAALVRGCVRPSVPWSRDGVPVSRRRHERGCLPNAARCLHLTPHRVTPTGRACEPAGGHQVLRGRLQGAVAVRGPPRRQPGAVVRGGAPAAARGCCADGGACPPPHLFVTPAAVCSPCCHSAASRCPFGCVCVESMCVRAMCVCLGVRVVGAAAAVALLPANVRFGCVCASYACVSVHVRVWVCG